MASRSHHSRRIQADLKNTSDRTSGNGVMQSENPGPTLCAHRYAQAEQCRCTLQACRSGPAPDAKATVSSVPLVKAPLSFAMRISSASELIGSIRIVSQIMLAKPWSLLMSHLHLDSASHVRTVHKNIKWLWHAQQGRTLRDLPAVPICLPPVDDVNH